MISPVVLSMASTMARLSSWMPLLRISSPPCWKPLFHGDADALYGSTGFLGQFQQTHQGAAVGQKIVDDQHMILRSEELFGHDDVVYHFYG